MEVSLRKYGNNTVVVLPPTVLKELGLAAGQLMSLSVTPDGAITLTPKLRYALADLLAEYDPSAPQPTELATWDMTVDEAEALAVQYLNLKY
jgi:antitoxin ChpS